MADQASENIKWEDETTKTGASYSVGRPDAPKPPVDEDRVGVKQSFQVDINWPVGADSWTDTPMDIRNKTGIYRWKLHLSASLLFKYVLEFSITEDHYNYYFGDAEGDSYNVDTWTSGNHYVQFNSKKPTITRISGN